MEPRSRNPGGPSSDSQRPLPRTDALSALLVDFFAFETVLHIPGRLPTPSVTKNDLEVLTLSPPPPEFWDSKCVDTRSVL